MRSIYQVFIAILLPTALLAKDQQSPAPNPALLFREVRYNGTLTDDEARFAVDIDVESLGLATSVDALIEGDVAVLAPRLPAALRIVRVGEQYQLVSSKPGRYKFKLDIVAKITRAEPWNRISFVGPSAAIASVTAQASGESVELQLLNGTVVETERKGAATYVRGFLGADRTLALRWQAKTTEAARKALVAAETTATIQITPTVIRYTTVLRYDIVQGSVPRFVVALPAAQALTRVEGEQIRDWQVKPGEDQQILTVELIKPVEKSYSLRLFSEQPVETTPFSAHLLPPQPLEVTRETGSLTVSAEDTLVELESAAGLRQINAPAEALAAYRFYARPAAVALKLRRIAPVVNVADRVTTRLEESRLTATHTLTLNVEKAGIYAVELSPLNSFVVTDVRGEGVEDWKTADGKLVVSFASRVLGARKLDIQLEQALKTFPDRIEVAPLRVANAAKETTQLGAASAPGIRLKTAEMIGLREIPVTSLAGRADELLAYNAEQPDWKLSLSAERLAPRIIADIFNLITVGDGLVGGSASVRFVIINQGVQEFRVRLPEHWKNVEFTGPNIRRKELRDGAAEKDSGQVWTIGLQEKAWGGYTLVVTYDFQFDPHQATLALGGIHALDVERESGTLAVTSASSVQLREKGAGDPLRRVDESELAQTDRALITRPVVLAYRYSGDAYELGLEVTRFEDQPVLQAVADRTQLTTVLTDAGEMLTQASFMVKNNDKQFQRFNLPRGADLWSCYVGGQPVKPERGGDAVLVPLPRAANRDAATPVEIVYAQKMGTLKSVFARRLGLAAPVTDIQTTYAEWELFVPDSHLLSGFGGNMTVARGTTYSLRDAWREFIRFYDALYRAGHTLAVAIVVILLFAYLVVAAIRRGWRGALAVLTVLAIIAILAGMMLPALNSARERSRRTQALNNLKQVGLALAQAADQRGGQLPGTLDEVLGWVGTEKVFVDAESGQRFVYVGGGRTWQEAGGDSVLAYSPVDRDGRNVLFSDGHVEWMTSAKFGDALSRSMATPLSAPPAAPIPSEAEVRNGAIVGGGREVNLEQFHAQGPVVSGLGGAVMPVVAGIRPIRIEIPRTGERFVFTKVLNVRDEALSVRAWAMPVRTRNTVRATLQLLAFVAGLIVWWRQWRRPSPSSLIVTVALALIVGGITSLLVSTRLLHVVLILGAPVVAVGILVWLARRYWPRLAHKPQTGESAAPPVIAAIALMLFAGTTIRADEANPSGVSIVSAEYVGAVREPEAKDGRRVAQFDAVIQLSAAEPGQTVALFGEEVAVQQFSASAGNAKLLREGKSVSVLLPKRGQATLRMKFLVKLAGDVAKQQLAFAIPAALSSRLVLTIDEPEAAVDFPTAVSFKSASDKQQTRVEAVIGPGGRVDLRWSPRMKRAAEIAATVFCQNATQVSFGGGVVNTRAALQYQITQGELRQARVRLPAGHRLLRVEGELIRTWELKEDNGEQIVSVELLKGVSPSYRLTIETEKLLDELPAQVRVEAPHALDVKRETGWLALNVSEELNLSVESAQEMQRVDAEEFARVAPVKAQTAASAYRFLKPEFDLRVRIEPVQPQIEAVVHNQIRVGAEQINASARVDYTIKRTGVFVLKLVLPPTPGVGVPADYRVEAVNGEQISQWVERKEEGGEKGEGSRVLEVTLKERTMGAYTLGVELVKPLRELPKTLDVAGVHPLGTQKLSGFVSVSAEPGVQLKAESFAGLTEAPAASVSDSGGGVLAYKFVVSEPAAQLPWKLAVATESVEPWVRAEVVTRLTLSETVASGQALVRYEIQNAPAKELRLRVPASFKNVEISGANIRRRDQDGEQWRVELQSKVRGFYTLTVTWEQPWSAKQEALEVTGIEAVGVERETGAIAVVARPPLQVEGKPAGSDLIRIDARELPEWAGRPDDATVLAYRYLRPGYRLALATKRYDEAEVLQAMVDNVRLTTVVADDGQMMTEMTLAVRNNARQFLEIGLPKDAQVWSAFVAGQAVRPSVRGGKLLLPLERAGSEDAPISVELTYVGAGKFPRGRGRVALESPALDVPLKNARWELYLPPDYQYGGFAGTMTRETATAPAYRGFTLTEYEKAEVQKRAKSQSELSAFVISARSNLAGGKLKEATESYGRVRSLGQSFDAVQSDDLKVLEKDLRRAQASNVMAGQEAVAKMNAGVVTSGQRQRPASREDTDAAEQQWDKLQQAQELAVAKVLPLRVTLPTHGVRFTFTQVLQTETGKAMKLRFAASNARTMGWPTRLGLGAGGFVALWVLVAAGLGRRHR